MKITVIFIIQGNLCAFDSVINALRHQNINQIIYPGDLSTTVLQLKRSN